MTLLQKSSIGLGLAAVLAAGLFEAHQYAKLRDEIETLRGEHLAFTERIRKLEEEHSKTEQQFTAFRKELQPPSDQKSVPISEPTAPTVTVLPSSELESEMDRAFAETSLGRREAAIERISKSISSSDIPRAIAHLATRPGMAGVESPLFSGLARRWGQSDPNAATAWADSLSEANTRKAAIVGIMYGWTHLNPEEAANYAAQLPAGDLQNEAVAMVAKEWGFKDPRGAANWVSAFPEGKLRDKAVEPIVFWGQGQAPAAVADMLDAIGSAELTQKYGETLATIWLSRDATAARVWIQRSLLSAEIKQKLLGPGDGAK